MYIAIVFLVVVLVIGGLMGLAAGYSTGMIPLGAAALLVLLGLLDRYLQSKKVARTANIGMKTSLPPRRETPKS